MRKMISSPAFELSNRDLVHEGNYIDCKPLPDQYENYADYIGSLALRAILYEVSTTPKPGLVDRMNSGSHHDMDYFLFVDSSAVIADDFRKMAQLGENFEGEDLSELFSGIRKIGINTEKRMFEITEGVNTQKGIIFSLGVLSAAAAYLMNKNDTCTVNGEMVCETAAQMVKGICQNELEQMDISKEKTSGEKLYLKHSIKGIRGEAESGYKSVLLTSLPTIRRYAGMYSKNDVLVNALLSLMTVTEDSNVMKRNGYETLENIQKKASHALDCGGMFTECGKSLITSMDLEFQERSISPGGSADLLAVSVLLALVEGIEFR